MELKTFADLRDALNNLPNEELIKPIEKNFIHSEGSNPITNLKIETTEENWFEDEEGYVIDEPTKKSLHAEDGNYDKLRFPKGTIKFSYD